MKPRCLLNADEKNRTSTSLRKQASETCASTSSATSAQKETIQFTEENDKFGALPECSSRLNKIWQFSIFRRFFYHLSWNGEKSGRASGGN
jgi:hypothetical protein